MVVVVFSEAGTELSLILEVISRTGESRIEVPDDWRNYPLVYKSHVTVLVVAVLLEQFLFLSWYFLISLTSSGYCSKSSFFFCFSISCSHLCSSNFCCSSFSFAPLVIFVALTIVAVSFVFAHEVEQRYCHVIIRDNV